MQDLNRLQALFDEAVELEGEARAAVIERACGDDSALRTPEEMRRQVLSGDAPKPSTAITNLPADADGRERPVTLETISASRSVPPGARSGDAAPPGGVPRP